MTLTATGSYPIYSSVSKCAGAAAFGPGVNGSQLLMPAGFLSNMTGVANYTISADLLWNDPLPAPREMMFDLRGNTTIFLQLYKSIASDELYINTVGFVDTPTGVIVPAGSCVHIDFISAAGGVTIKKNGVVGYTNAGIDCSMGLGPIQWTIAGDDVGNNSWVHGTIDNFKVTTP